MNQLLRLAPEYLAVNGPWEVRVYRISSALWALCEEKAGFPLPKKGTLGELFSSAKAEIELTNHLEPVPEPKIALLVRALKGGKVVEAATLGGKMVGKILFQLVDHQEEIPLFPDGFIFRGQAYRLDGLPTLLQRILSTQGG